MIGWKLNDDGDITISPSGGISLLDTVQEAVKQRLQVKFRTFQTEWFLDQSYGMPYFNSFFGTGTILGKGLTQVERDALYVTEALKDPDVIRVNNLVSNQNNFTRLYDIRFEVQTTDGLLRTQTLSLTPAQEIQYPIPSDQPLNSSCDIDFVNWTNDLHPIVHYYLPMGPEFGWIGDLDYGLNDTDLDGV